MEPSSTVPPAGNRWPTSRATAIWWPAWKRRSRASRTATPSQSPWLPAEGYGVHDAALIHRIPKRSLQGSGEIKKGMQFQGQTPEGMRVFTVTAVVGDMVTLDGNHPLADKTLNFGRRDRQCARGHYRGTRARPRAWCRRASPLAASCPSLQGCLGRRQRKAAVAFHVRRPSQSGVGDFPRAAYRDPRSKLGGKPRCCAKGWVSFGSQSSFCLFLSASSSLACLHEVRASERGEILGNGIERPVPFGDRNPERRRPGSPVRANRP